MLYFQIFYLIKSFNRSYYAKRYDFWTYQSVFEFLSITFTDIETRISVHNESIFAAPYLHLSGYLMTDYIFSCKMRKIKIMMLNTNCIVK